MTVKSNLYLTRNEKIFYGFLGKPTGFVTHCNEEICVGDSVVFFFGEDRHDILSGLIVEVNGNFKVMLNNMVHNLSGLNFTKICRSHKDLKVGDKTGLNGLFKVNC